MTRQIAEPATVYVHNTDLNPSDEYLKSVPLLRVMLRTPELLQAFGGYDEIANKNQRMVRLTGMASLWLAGTALGGTTLELLLAAIGVSVPAVIVIILEVLALASIVLALAPHVFHTRTTWLTARFMTEQMRQWQFQMLFDGDLIALASEKPSEFTRVRLERWNQLMLQAPNAEGAMNTFVDGDAVRMRQSSSAYANAEMGRQATRAYLDLRFEKQLSYMRFKKEEFSGKDEWSEALAKTTLFLAVLLAAGHIVIEVGSILWQPIPHSAGASIGAAAIILVILSAIVRTYRSALAIPQQRERYESTWVRLVALRSAFDAAESIEKRRDLMVEVEALEIEEMREFLRQMRRATYLL